VRQVARVTAVIAWGKRPVPFRTRKLRPTAPMVLHPRECGRVGHRRTTPQQEGPAPPGAGPSPPKTPTPRSDVTQSGHSRHARRLGATMLVHVGTAPATTCRGLRRHQPGSAASAHPATTDPDQPAQVASCPCCRHPRFRTPSLETACRRNGTSGIAGDAVSRVAAPRALLPLRGRCRWRA
jgi:hypothetical protein